MSQLLTNCGSKRCSMEELQQIPEPEATKTYTPLSHFDFAYNVKQVASDLLKDHVFDEEQYALGANGKRLFGVLTFTPKWEEIHELNVAIGLRNSYDRSMSAGVAVGNSVLVCDNLMFSSNIVVMRKHQGKNMHEDLHSQIIAAIYKMQHQFTRLSEDVQRMKQIPLNRRQKFEYLGLLTGEGILSPTQSSKAYREVWEPSHEEFKEDRLWSAYNAATEALKSSSPQDIVKKHSQLHQLTEQLYLN
mgnify:CR=1 FL=1